MLLFGLLLKVAPPHVSCLLLRCFAQHLSLFSKRCTESFHFEHVVTTIDVMPSCRCDYRLRSLHHYCVRNTSVFWISVLLLIRNPHMVLVTWGCVERAYHIVVHHLPCYGFVSSLTFCLLFPIRQFSIPNSPILSELRLVALCAQPSSPVCKRDPHATPKMSSVLLQHLHACLCYCVYVHESSHLDWFSCIVRSQ